MTSKALIGLLFATMTIGAAMPVGAAHQRKYVLNGYSFGRMPGVNTAEVEAKLKPQAGGLITEAQVDADQAIVQHAVEAAHLKGQIIATTAEKKGRVWIIFDLLDLPTMPAGPRVRHLMAQNFQGASHVSADALAAATGLKHGDKLTPENMRAARRAILALYAKMMPGRPISLTGRIQTTLDGSATITWIVKETN